MAGLRERETRELATPLVSNPQPAGPLQQVWCLDSLAGLQGVDGFRELAVSGRIPISCGAKKLEP